MFLFSRQFIRAGLAIFLGLIFFSSGMAKLFYLHKFPGLIGPVWLEDVLSKHNLGLFARFIAYSQVSMGFLLLTFRFRTIGAIMLLPMLLNIFLITVSQNWVGTPYLIAIFLVLNLWLLWFDHKKLLPLITGIPIDFERDKIRKSNLGHLVWSAGFAVNLAAIQISFYNFKMAYLVCLIGFVISYLGFFVDKRKLHPKKDPVLQKTT